MLPPGFPAHSTTTLVVARALGASLCTSPKVQQLPPAVQFYPGKSVRMSFINLPIETAANVLEQIRSGNASSVGRPYELGPNRRQVETVPRLWPRALGKTHR